MLAYEELLDNQCPGCGGQLDETTDPAHEHEWHAPPPTRCFKCDAKLRAQERYAKASDKGGRPLVPRPQALLWEVRRR